MHFLCLIQQHTLTPLWVNMILITGTNMRVNHAISAWSDVRLQNLSWCPKGVMKCHTRHHQPQTVPRACPSDIQVPLLTRSSHKGPCLYQIFFRTNMRVNHIILAQSDVRLQNLRSQIPRAFPPDVRVPLLTRLSHKKSEKLSEYFQQVLTLIYVNCKMN